MRSRLFWKLFLALWLSIVGFAVLMAVINAHLANQAIPEAPGERFKRDIGVLEQQLGRALQAQGPQGARRVLRRLPRQVRNHVYVLDEHGAELLGRDFIAGRLDQRNGQHIARELRDAQGGVYRLVVMRRPPPRALLAPGFRGILHRLVIAALVAALVSYFLARQLVAPMERLGEATRKLAGGDLSTRVGPPVTGRKDEFGRLAADVDEMAARLEELQTANRRLLRDVSHELRSPLARLRVALEIARNRDAGVVTGELDRIELESERLEALVDEVLDLLRESSGSGPLQRTRFDVRELLADLQQTVNYEAPDGSPGMVVEAGEPLPVHADRELLWRALENLVRNALLHTDARQGVEVVARRDDASQWIEITVADRGPGLAEQHLEKIFEPFYRVQEARDRDSGGHGLGLAIAAAAVRRHRGEISAHNRAGGGLEMRLRFPPR
ncbi:MAG: HAMP domain-containing protein [Xanthomonadales bacterium]|nr:HAMP domain-containing protein [Xanthomonadales bacterium]